MSSPVPQSAAIDPDSLGAADRARFWRAPRHDGLEGLTARFCHHRYPRHTHDGYVMGVITAGCETFWCRGQTWHAGAGTVCFVNPGEVHDGEPLGGFYAYRMIYPSLALVGAIAAEIMGSAGGTPFFRAPLVEDPPLARAFAALHDRLPDAACPLEGDEAVLRVIGMALARHSGAREVAERDRASPGAFPRVRAIIEERFAEPLDLGMLAGEVGLSRFQLIRSVKAACGTTPHGLLLDRRVRAARDRLRNGEPPAEVAAACGFADQSHLSRAFRARIGVPPGAYGACGTRVASARRRVAG